MSDVAVPAGEPPNLAGAARDALRAFALGLPGAYEEFPWGESVVKVNKKVFVFLGMAPAPDMGLSFSVKLPISGDDVLSLPFTEPTGYGLGKHGWVTARFMPGEQPPVAVACDWIVESYRAVAPKKLVAQLDSNTPSG
jgi:predicted DNA-binding protein (MmcQ/YjbR family)